MQHLAPGYLHLHPQVDHEHWVAELSQYDAGWLHVFHSENGGELHRANWADLNYPARIPTLVAAGVPLAQYDNAGHMVAMQSLVRDLDLGLFWRKVAELEEQLRDAERMAQVRDNG